MANALALLGLALLGLIVLVVLGIVIWLVVRPGPSAEAPGAAGTEARAPEADGVSEDEAERSGAGFEVTRAAGGPHPRPRELDRESRRELLLLDERLHRALFDRSEMSPEEWARIADRLLIVHDRLPVGILLERFERLTDTHVSAPGETDRSPREVAALLNERLSPEHRMEPMGTLSEPVEADIYAAPRSNADSAG